MRFLAKKSLKTPEWYLKISLVKLIWKKLSGHQFLDGSIFRIENMAKVKNMVFIWQELHKPKMANAIFLFLEQNRCPADIFFIYNLFFSHKKFKWMRFDFIYLFFHSVLIFLLFKFCEIGLTTHSIVNFTLRLQPHYSTFWSAFFSSSTCGAAHSSAFAPFHWWPQLLRKSLWVLPPFWVF